MFSFTKIVVASHNEGKVREIRDLLVPLGIETVSAGELGLDDPEETEPTFEGNAALKARAAAEASSLPALSDDSGLAVAALDGAPGIYSARWAGEPRDFGRAMEKVWTAMSEAESDDRAAKFVCVLALAEPGGVHTWRGEVEGEIVWPPRGGKGFGYDPIFQPPGRKETFAEIEPQEKHAMSHRARAFDKFLAALKSGAEPRA
ncbi:MAG: RdgB/HAM1 family non-canonical purine NTP pyrophosphatase [Euryhalocaulis sp.]|uniref:RdgB/HAM1 family non-canonical purine NTP pyrophosphatase n=1 Tax=Euryhalocaulis sp. TaxID=2744307 RepID=UPI001836360D|nr:RdgB/HAM1 family non-canonical purine NTP pyrophosphatase [Euryhalocaulis sp.]MBA4802798.1 RdgB/HAM1 family non-canonical purine NTP pyrophosphatase [Euryhalocaulis sp.]